MDNSLISLCCVTLMLTGDGKCVVCDSYVRPATLVRICDECNYGSYQVSAPCAYVCVLCVYVCVSVSVSV